MNRFVSTRQLFITALLGASSFGCESGGVGDPCIPEDEYRQEFNGFAVTEVNVESRSFQCETRVCIVNHFQGRVSCPYGQTEGSIPDVEPVAEGAGLSPQGALPPNDPARCRIPGTAGWVVGEDGSNIDAIRVPVDPQLVFRSAEDTVYCSCRCNGPDPNARYCECPSGFVCEELVRDVGVPGRGQLVGSYCIKPNTKYEPTRPPDPDVCSIARASETVDDGNTNRTRNIGETCGRTADGEARNPPL